MRLLVVEDEVNLAQILKRRLKEEGYSVDMATNGEDALDLLDTVRYDAVVLDVMLPGVDGLTILRHIRQQRYQTPVLVLTARDALEDKVKGLDSGADDYLTKPFAFAELLARLRALLRRSRQEHEVVLKIADLEVNTVQRRVMRAGREIELTTKEYALLEYLMQNRGRVLSRSQIAEHIWDYDFNGASNIVDVYIRYLRRKIDEDFELKLIQTVRGAGYRLKEPEDHAV